jgi:ATP-dependent Clp protease adaptor protein ClpS
MKRRHDNIARASDAGTDATPDILDQPDVETEIPRLYNVLLHNDDYTTTEFVVEVLVVVFRKGVDEAVGIMLNVHRKGIGTAGTYSYDIAVTKAQRVREMAREREFPLLCTVEPA